MCRRLFDFVDDDLPLPAIDVCVANTCLAFDVSEALGLGSGNDDDDDGDGVDGVRFNSGIGKAFPLSMRSSCVFV